VIDLLVVALAFGAIFVVELPDKTFIATLVMSTRMRPLLVWIGVALAFLVQTGVAVGVGKAASFLPEQLIHTVAALMFVIGAIILFREARSADEDEGEQEDEYAAKATAQGFRVIVTSFLVLFAAEWGDLSQLLTISLVAKYDDPFSVFAPDVATRSRRRPASATSAASTRRSARPRPTASSSCSSSTAAAPLTQA
jgi:Ca2+/H+ antiporter, TMEM165/GDT1 family